MLHGWRCLVVSAFEKTPSCSKPDRALTLRLAVVFFLTIFVRQQLAPVDFEELRKARYELKGA